MGKTKSAAAWAPRPGRCPPALGLLGRPEGLAEDRERQASLRWRGVDRLEDHRLELAHVAREGVASQQGIELGRGVRRLLAELGRRRGDEALDEEGQVAEALAQGRDADAVGPQPVVEVPSEMRGLDGRVEVAVGRHDEAGSAPAHEVGAEGEVLARLDDAQELELGGGR